MNEELSALLEFYDKLSLNSKRNELSNLIGTIDGIVGNLLTLEELGSGEKVKNYDSVNDSKMTEDEMLKFLYEDLWNLKTKLLLFLTSYVSKK